MPCVIKHADRWANSLQHKGKNVREHVGLASEDAARAELAGNVHPQQKRYYCPLDVLPSSIGAQPDASPLICNETYGKSTVNNSLSRTERRRCNAFNGFDLSL